MGQIRNSAGYYFDRVAAGESFDVVRRGRLVARIVPSGESGRAELHTPVEELAVEAGQRSSAEQSEAMS